MTTITLEPPYASAVLVFITKYYSREIESIMLHVTIYQGIFSTKHIKDHKDSVIEKSTKHRSYILEWLRLLWRGRYVHVTIIAQLT